MRVAGVGFRAGATAASLRDALAAAGGVAEVLATVEAKVPALRKLAEGMGLTVLGVSSDLLARQAVLTHSARVAALHDTGSVAEAAALAAVGTGGHLLGPRVVSADGMATAAIAEGRAE